MQDDRASRDIDYARAAYTVFLGLDNAIRARVGAVAASADAGREIAPGLYSMEAVPGLRVVTQRGADRVTVLALTGDVAASCRESGRLAS